MPLMESTRLSAGPSEDSRESSAEMTNTSLKEISPKDAAILETEVETLTKALSSVSNEAARMVTRQHWRKCLIGTERDQSFLVRAILKHSTPHVYMRAMEDYGAKMLEAASDDVLDRALELRLPSIDADKLVALLAKAKRLGYDEQDMVDDDEEVLPTQDTLSETVKSDARALPIPQPQDVVMVDRSDRLPEEQIRNATPVRSSSAPYQQSIPSSYSQNMNLPTRRKAKDPTSRKFVCPDCTASFAQQGGLTYHMDRKVCHRPAPQFKWFCQKCGKGFTPSGGKLYHEQNKVCESHESATATPPTSNLQPGLVAIKPTPSPQLPNRLPLPDLPGRSRSAQASPLPSLPPQQVQQNGQGQYNPSYSTGRSSLPPLTQSRPPWPSQRIESLPQAIAPNAPKYPSYRASIGPTFQTTPTRQSPASDSTPSDITSLDPTTQAQLNAKIAAETARFEKKCRELPDTLSAAEREDAINREKRGHATRKSQIRKKFGIQIRTSKLQQANFVNLPSQGVAPVLAPISRIDAFRAPATLMTPTYAISTPSSIEQGRQRQRPLMEDPDPKRRRLESPALVEQHSESQRLSEPRVEPSGGQHDSNNTQSPEILEVDSAKENKETLPSPQVSNNKLPKRVQWESLPQPSTTASTPPPPPSSPPPALRDISNKGPRLPTPTSNSPEKRPKRSSRGSSVELVVIAPTTLDDDDHNNNAAVDLDDDDDEDDSDVDLDEDIPARLPPGMAPRRTSTRTRSGTTSSTSVSASMSPGPVAVAAVAPPKRKKKIGKGLFPPTPTEEVVVVRAVVAGGAGAGGGGPLSASRSVVEV